LDDSEAKRPKTIKKKETSTCTPITDEKVLAEKSKFIFEKLPENEQIISYIKPFVDNTNINIFTKSLFDISSEKNDEDRLYVRKTILTLIKNKIISVSNITLTINDIISEAPLNFPDIPHN